MGHARVPALPLHNCKISLGKSEEEPGDLQPLLSLTHREPKSPGVGRGGSLGEDTGPRVLSFRPGPATASSRQEGEGPAGRGAAPERARGWVGKAASRARPLPPPLPSFLPSSDPRPGLPSSLRCALPEAALVAASPCPSRARSLPPPRGPGALQRPATPRSMPMIKTVDHRPGQETRKDQMRKIQQAMEAVNPPEPMLAEQPGPPRYLLPWLHPASLPV